MGRMQGHRDSPLTGAGRNQAKEASKLLKGENISTVVCSSSGRALETAEIMTAAMGNIAIIPEDDLREIDFGRWEGQKKADVEKDYAQTYHDFWHSPEIYEPLGGETFRALWQRSVGVFERLANTYPGQTIVIVSHAAPIKAILSHCTGRSMGEIWEPPVAGNLSHSVIQTKESGERFVHKFCGEAWMH